MMLRWPSWLGLLGLLWLCGVGHVWAHSELVEASPAPGERLAEAPTEIRLTFSEAVGEETAVYLLTADFRPIAELTPTVEPDDPRQIFAPLPPLTAETYLVQWTAVSADGHKISGSYNFQVAAADATSPFWLYGGLLLLLLGVVGFVWRRRRPS